MINDIVHVFYVNNIFSNNNLNEKLYRYVSLESQKQADIFRI